jgi:hypothetical protein
MDVIRRLCALVALTPDETPVGLPNQQEAGCAPAAVCKHCGEINFFSIPTIESQYNYAKSEKSEYQFSTVTELHATAIVSLTEAHKID